MNAAQIDQALEKLMLELQGFKHSSALLTDAGTKAEEAVAAAKVVLMLSEQIRKDNQSQVEAVQKYTTTSEQNLRALVASVAEAQTMQKEALIAVEQAFQQETAALVQSVESIRNQQEESTAKLERAILGLTEEQRHAQARQLWLIVICSSPL